MKHDTQGIQLKEYWVNHTSLDEQTINQVDWEAIGQACGSHKFIKKQWSSKVSVNFLPTATVMEEMGTISMPECTCYCRATHAMTEHVLVCPKGDSTWQ
eukprot:6034365-Ditylum_brightwellii.AAC.1